MELGVTTAPPESDENAIDFKVCETSLKRYFSRRVRGRWDVDDLVQDTLIRYYGSERSTTIEQPMPYLYRIANNLLIDNARRRAVATPAMEMLQHRQQSSARAEQEDAIHLGDLQTALEAALDELPPKCREAFILRRFHDEDTPAIANRLNVSHRMVQKYLIRAIEHLHERLKF